MDGEIGPMTDRNCLHPVRLYSGSLAGWRVREDIPCLVEIVNLGQHQLRVNLPSEIGIGSHHYA